MNGAAAILVVAALAGCAREQSATMAKTGVAWLDRDNTPVDIKLTFDTTTAASATIGEEGGSVSATGSDGSYFELEIPQGALHRREKITMIPVSRVDGLPLEKGGSVATVQLEPEGLRFDKPVKLTIEPSKPVPVKEQVGFAWITHGTDTHLYPAQGDSMAMEMQLLHFSGYGFGKAPPGDPGRTHLVNASAQLARLEAELAQATEAERLRQLQLTPPNAEESAKFTETYRRIMDEYFDAIVKPTMVIAETDEKMAECALRYYTDWLRRVELTGLAPNADGDWNKDGTPTPQGMRKDPEMVNRMMWASASASKIFANAESKVMANAQKACREQHDLTAFDRFIALYHSLQLIGIKGANEDANFKALPQALKDCDRFEVELSSSIDSRLPSGAWHFTVTSTAQYAPDDAAQDAPLNYATLEISGRPGRDVLDAFTSGRGDALLQNHQGNPFKLLDWTISKRGSRHGTVKVEQVHWQVVERDTVGTSCKGADESQKTNVADSMDVTLRIDPPTEIVRFTNPPLPPQDSDMHEWMRYFTMFRKAGGTDVARAPEANRNDDSGAQPEFVTVRVKQQSPGVWSADFRTAPGEISEGLSETGHLILRHTPK